MEEFVELKVSDLYIGTEQHRTDNVGKEVEELAESIKQRGLLQPIRVVPGEGPNAGKYAVVIGQRRFLACQRFLGWEKIPAIISTKKKDDIEYLIDSVTENTMRLGTTDNEDRQVCVVLWRRFGDIKSICKITGLSEYFVRKHLKWDALPPTLKKLVDTGEVSLDAADKAIEVSKYDDNMGEEEVIDIARKLNPLANADRARVKKIKKSNQSESTTEIIKQVEAETHTPVIVVKLGEVYYKGLETLATKASSTPEEVAHDIIVQKLSEMGYDNEE
jgi:ParB/RepB/Spo0J family partition protein